MGWSAKAAREAGRLGGISIAAEGDETNVPQQQDLRIPEDASYVYYCDNETVHGIEFNYVPDTGRVPLVADMSSNILTRPFDIRKFGAIWFGAQKNFGIAGLTIAAVRHDLIGRAPENCPVMLDWKSYSSKNSMLNTPPTSRSISQTSSATGLKSRAACLKWQNGPLKNRVRSTV